MTLENIINSKVGTVQFILNADDLKAFADEIINRVCARDQSQEAKLEDELLTREKVMAYLGIKSTTLWQWAKMGIITPIKIKRKCFYRKSDILALQTGKSMSNNNLKNHKI